MIIRLSQPASRAVAWAWLSLEKWHNLIMSDIFIFNRAMSDRVKLCLLVKGENEFMSVFLARATVGTSLYVSLCQSVSQLVS